MRKTTTFTRKRARTEAYQIAQKSPEAAALLNAYRITNVLRFSRPFDEESGTLVNAVGAANDVKAALTRMIDGTSDNVRDFDQLAAALGIAEVRAFDIGGEALDAMDAPILAGNAALKKVQARYAKWGKFQIEPSEAQSIVDAVEIYETILFASSPRQMANAVDARMRIIKEQRRLGILPPISNEKEIQKELKK